MRDSKYKVAWCPICNQGWVEIVKDKITNELYVCCDECESEWMSPDAVESIELSTQWKYGETIEPAYAEIVHKKWDKYMITR